MQHFQFQSIRGPSKGMIPEIELGMTKWAEEIFKNHRVDLPQKSSIVFFFLSLESFPFNISSLFCTQLQLNYVLCLTGVYSTSQWWKMVFKMSLEYRQNTPRNRGGVGAELMKWPEIPWRKLKPVKCYYTLIVRICPIEHNPTGLMPLTFENAQSNWNQHKQWTVPSS